MNYRIVLSPGAKADIKSVIRWYLNIDPNLAARFLVEYKTVLRRIRRWPYEFAIRTDASRRARMNRFPYYVRYTVAMSVVTITAIAQQRRGNSRT